MIKNHMYLIFRDTLDHTLLYLVDAPNEHAALHQFVLREMPSVLFNPNNQTYLVPDMADDMPDIWYRDLKALIHGEFMSGEIRFEIREAPPLAGKEFVDLFCSKDQIYQVSDEQFDHTMTIKHCQMGLLYRSRNRYREAVQEFRSALANAPNDYATLTLLADTLVQCDEVTAAVQVYEQSLAFVSPSNKIDCCLKIGQLYRSLGDHASAAAFLSQYLDLADDEDARFRRSELDDASEIEDEDAREAQAREEIRHYLSTMLGTEANRS